MSQPDPSKSRAADSTSEETKSFVRHEVGPISLFDDLDGQTHSRMGLAHAVRPQQQQVGSVGHEGMACQFFDLAPVGRWRARS